MIFLQLFVAFLLIGFFSFGGGYAMIPIIEEEVVERFHWMSANEFTEVIAVAGMAPGPVATNSAVFIGYHTAGLPGAIIAAFAMTLPSLLLVISISMFLYRYIRYRSVKCAFYGLRPVITGFIIYAALSFAMRSGMIGSASLEQIGLIAIFAGSLFLLMKYRLHPLAVIGLSGVAGIVIYL
ncbi:chromate transporter [Marinicrinis lubricantis]|uniref:Chromate transporter n=1 Tax=Marinicrinis lubricantis TaxID=2086470 RepID=A0ABW1ILI8_9BACL